MSEGVLIEHRRLLVPEVVQTSGMDCGPASLKSILEGFGVTVSYGRLREACQTDVDGTSINTLEEVLCALGFEAEQIVIPVDHLLIPKARALPGILVVRLPNGFAHFVVIWRRFGPFVQIMDPAIGRRWTTCAQLLSEVYLHTVRVPAAAYREWVGSEVFLRPFRERLDRLGASQGGAKHLEVARGDPTWRSLATLDASTRMVESLIESGALQRGAQAVKTLGVLIAQAAHETATDVIPEMFWAAQPDSEGDVGAGARSPSEEELVVRGAILLTVRGRRPDARGPSHESGLSADLMAALNEAPRHPGIELLHMLGEDGAFTPLLLGLGTIIAAGGVVLEALLLSGIFDLAYALESLDRRFAAGGALVLLLGLLMMLELAIVAGTLRLGRHLETRLRVAFLDKIPRIEDRYFQSRPASDMAERSHSLHRIRQLPTLGGRLIRTVLELGITTGAIAWLDRQSAPFALSIALIAVVIPVAAQPVLLERDLRMRTHVGALSRFYLDALLGIVAIRTHRSERALRREHEPLVVEWARAGRAFTRAVISVEGIQISVGFGLAAWLFIGALSRGGATSAPLLLLYWALNLPMLGLEIGLLARQYPAHRNITLRLLEPLGAIERGEHSPDDAVPPSPDRDGSNVRPIAVRLEKVSVLAAGHAVLNEVDLHVPAGSHVAIVGASGAGKSSLLGLLLGWHRPVKGCILVDGIPLEGAQAQALRQACAWVDPAIQIWNRSLYDNLLYGTPESTDELGSAMSAADLFTMLESLPEGMQTILGEGGALVSGGQGQRVRLGRAMLRRRPRLVLLDEPFRGLDRERRKALMEQARKWWKGATLLCVTHDVSETRGFDRVLVMEGGRIVEDGIPEVLAGTPGSRYASLITTEATIRQELWSSQVFRKLRIEHGKVIEEHGPES